MYRTLPCLCLPALQLMLIVEVQQYSLVVAENGMFGYQATTLDDPVLGECPYYGDCSSSQQSCSCDGNTCPFYHNCCPLLIYGFSMSRIPEVVFDLEEVGTTSFPNIPATTPVASRIDSYGPSACVSITLNYASGTAILKVDMVVGCPPDSDEDVDDRCRLTAGKDRSIVVGSTSGALFRNADCAACNGETDVKHWNGTSGCEQDVITKLNCSIVDYSSWPASVRLSHCEPDVISSCPVKWHDDEVAQRCTDRGGLTLVVYSGSMENAKTFRNHFCATCHGLSEYTCHQVSYAVPMNEIVNFASPEILVPLRMPTACIWTTVNRSELTIREDGNATFSDKPEVVYGPDEFVVSDGIAQVCIVGDPVTVEQVPRGRSIHYTIQTWATVLLSAVSLVMLFVLFIVYLVFPSLRNTPGRCVMCLVASLFVGQFLYLFVDLKYAGETFCYVQSVVLHYAFLAAFAWMNVMSYDVFRTFSGTSTAPSMSSQSGLVSSHRFTFYSIYAWLFPGLIVLASVVADTALKDITGFWRPHYGEGLCWLLNGFPLLLFFGVPVGILLVNNVGLFISSAVHIYRASAASRMASRSSNHTQLLILYVKLFFVMGIAWLFGFFASLTGWTVLWYLHVIFSSLQGAIISVSFLVSKQVRRLLRDSVCPGIGPKQMGRTQTTGASSSSERHTSTKRLTAL